MRHLHEPMAPTLTKLVKEIQACELCKKHLPRGPHPIFRVGHRASILLVGQAPGAKVHASGIPWDDASGNVLREWLQLTSETFYDQNHVALMPMGFCYPGKGHSGDLPPRSECAPLWHPPLLKFLKGRRLTLLIGQYAQSYYLGDRVGRNLTETVRRFREFLPEYFPLPHPSPRNRPWLHRNPWFEKELIPELRLLVQKSLSLTTSK